MRRALLVTVILAPLLAGCALPAPGAPQPEAASGTPGAEAIPWGLTACRFVVAFVPMEAERLRPFLPEGFEPGSFGPGLAGVQGASLGIEAFTCEAGAGLGGSSVSPMTYGSTFAGVVPPDDLLLDGVETYYVKWDTLVPDAPRRELLAARGLPARAGDAAIADAVPGGPALTATLDLEGVGRFTIQGAADAPREGSGGPFAEFMPREDGGLARWSATASEVSVAQGRGVLEVPAGSLAAQVLGTERAPALFITGTWTFEEASLLLEARAPPTA